MELQGWIGGLSGALVVAVTTLTILFQQAAVASQLPTTVMPRPNLYRSSFPRCKQFATRSARYHDVLGMAVECVQV
jgi:hypothetical protein